jgi:hypothetical protein
VRKIVLVAVALAFVASALAQPLPELRLPINISIPPTTLPPKAQGIDLLSLVTGFVIGVIITIVVIWILMYWFV